MTPSISIENNSVRHVVYSHLLDGSYGHTMRNEEDKKMNMNCRAASMPHSIHAIDGRYWPTNQFLKPSRNTSCDIPAHCCGSSCRHSPCTSSNDLFASRAIPNSNCTSLHRVLYKRVSYANHQAPKDRDSKVALCRRMCRYIEHAAISPSF